MKTKGLILNIKANELKLKVQKQQLGGILTLDPLDREEITHSFTKASEAMPDISNSFTGSGLISGQRKLAICSL